MTLAHLRIASEQACAQPGSFDAGHQLSACTDRLRIAASRHRASLPLVILMLCLQKQMLHNHCSRMCLACLLLCLLAPLDDIDDIMTPRLCLQTLGLERGLPFTPYRKGIDARERMTKALAPVIGNEIDKYTQGGGQTGEADSIMTALLQALAAGDLPLDTPEGRQTAIALVNDALFLQFAGVPARLRMYSSCF